MGDTIYGPAIEFVDVTGDGRLDVIAFSFTATGTIHVWHGRLGGLRRFADATLDAPPAPNFNTSLARWLLFHDITGDGIEDIVVVAPYDSSFVLNGGAIHVFQGGPGLLGNLTPTATLQRASPVAGDMLGDANGGQGVAFGDVTGDGIDDIVAAAPLADVAGSLNTGMVAVWAGGATLSGTVAPTARLTIPGEPVWATLGYLAGSQSFELVDVDGDAVRDVIVPAPLAPEGGRVLVWRGGAALIGAPPPTATLFAQVTVGDLLGMVEGGHGVQIADVTGDGLADVIAASNYADFGKTLDAGAVFVWAGRSGLSGTVLPTAVLGRLIAQGNDHLASGHQGLRVVDVTGDGTPDIVTASPDYNVGKVGNAGAIHVWAGGSGLAGPLAPTATLTVPGAVTGDRLGYCDQRQVAQGWQLADVTGDGFPDLVVPNPNARRAGVPTAGLILVFAGGPTLSGSVTPLATLEPTGGKGGALGKGEDGRGMAVEDVTGDGIPDVIATSPALDRGSNPRTGAIYVWRGGATMMGSLKPTARYFGSGAYEFLGAGDLGFQCGEFTGDDVLDIVVVSYLSSDSSTRTSLGRGWVLEGGAGLSGLVTPVAVLERPWAVANDLCCYGSACRIADLDGNDIQDLVVGTPAADVNGLTDAGVIAWWPDARPQPSGGSIDLHSPRPEALERFGR
jgi:hypothetical protein